MNRRPNQCYVISQARGSAAVC